MGQILLEVVQGGQADAALCIRRRPKSWKRHDGRSPMLHKVCDTCGEPAINGVRKGDGVEWYCQHHEYEARLHPFDSEALGQW